MEGSLEAVSWAAGTPRDIKTRFKFLHRGLWTQHKTAQVALLQHRLVSDRCILCKYAKGTHLHFIECINTQQLFEWLEDFGLLMNIQVKMSTEDRVYGTVNSGDEMHKGLRFFYSILIKHLWIAYTAHNKQGTHFSEKQVWLAATRRLRTVLHAFEIETIKRFAQIDRLMHPLAGYTSNQIERAKEKETSRRNDKLSPFGEIIADKDGVRIERSFLWRDLAKITEEEDE